MVATMPGKFLARAQSFANAAIGVEEDSSGTVEIFEASEVPLG